MLNWGNGICFNSPPGKHKTVQVSRLQRGRETVSPKKDLFVSYVCCAKTIHLFVRFPSFISLIIFLYWLSSWMLIALLEQHRCVDYFRLERDLLLFFPANVIHMGMNPSRWSWWVKMEWGAISYNKYNFVITFWKKCLDPAGYKESPIVLDHRSHLSQT